MKERSTPSPAFAGGLPHCEDVVEALDELMRDPIDLVATRLGVISAAVDDLVGYPLWICSTRPDSRGH